MAVADAGAPKSDGRALSPQPGRRWHAAAADVIQPKRAGIPRHLGRGSAGHVRVLTNCGRPFLHDHGPPPEPWAAAVGFLRAQALGSHGAASWCGVRGRHDWKHEHVMRERLPRDDWVGPSDWLGAAYLARNVATFWVLQVSLSACCTDQPVWCTD
jgi:hypothetical protein